jgi:hypothetical protein
MRREYTPGSLDIALEYLRAHRLPYGWSERDLKVWLAVCPACRASEWGLAIREPRKFGGITLTCRSGCTAEEIRAALEAEPVHPQLEALEAERDQALDLAEAARNVAADALALPQQPSEAIAA